MALVSVTTDELEQVVGIFRTSVEKESQGLLNAKLDINKIVNQFENLIRQKVQVVPSLKEDIKEQDLKNEIEKMQRKALRLKTQIQNNRTMFVEEVRRQAEKQFEERRPRLDDLNIEHSEDIPQDIEKHFRILDESIMMLEKQISKEKNEIKDKITNVESFLRESQLFFSSLE